eukprot:CAMPEP_0179443740 /NCGR_PEP_ID=MMETSP0799-20121207/27205_1 /TAXON_ID=46947 /ORGANISM="Geminigera cryophila, Strain CCMP2564" /LENGTH=331 /DNA_ID=CAMNT_0021230123 /DNA_START=104 /DNA_END=1099 /DNA_ORIENTATION=-
MVVLIHTGSKVGAPVEMADLVDPDGVNPQRLVDVMNDLQASVEMGTGKTRTTIADTRKLLDKHLAIIVDTQTLKSGGLPGPKGPDGRQGYPGYQGAVGAEGDRGPTGNVGEIGSKGFPGPQGLRGKLGDTGPEGARGGKGITGPPGFDGPLGPKGQLGTPGARGPRGPRGMAGYQGLRGAQGLPGMKGPRGLKGGWTVIDAQKKCKELGGKEYLGVCLKSQRLDSNADTVPFKCNAFQPKLNWDASDWEQIAKLFQTNTNWGTHVKSYWNGNQGGLCGFREAIMAFTYRSSNNDLWLRHPTFSYTPPLTYPGWRTKCDYVTGSTGIYACSI